MNTEKSTKEKALSGLRIGASLGAFLIGGMLMGDGFDLIVQSTATQDVFRTACRGWAELIVAAVILFFTARTWLMLLAGCMLFGTFKALILLASASFPAGGVSTRGEALAVLLYCVATLLLLFRFAHKTPNPLDKIALTIFVFCLWPAATNSAFSWWQGVGLMVLLLAWGTSRLKRLNRVAVVPSESDCKVP